MTSEAAELLARALEQDAEAHESGRFHEIALRWDDVYGEILPIQDTSEPSFALALKFWDDWCDAANHEWQYHEPMVQEDWPRVARVIASCLKSGRLPRDQETIRQFMPEPKIGLIAKIKGWYRGLN